MMTKNFAALSLFILQLTTTITSTTAIGHNGRIDMLHSVNHKEEIDSLLNKRYTGDAAASGEIHRVKEVLSNNDTTNERSSSSNGRGSGSRGGKKISRKALLMASKTGYMVNTELDNVVTNILEASEIVERESMISSNNQK
eukprot:232412_1